MSQSDFTVEIFQNEYLPADGDEVNAIVTVTAPNDLAALALAVAVRGLAARRPSCRRSASRGLDPEIDLTGPPTDPGISHLHAVLIAQPDGTWSVLDPGSSNGTQVNGTDLVTGVPVPCTQVTGSA